MYKFVPFVPGMLGLTKFRPLKQIIKINNMLQYSLILFYFSISASLVKQGRRSTRHEDSFITCYNDGYSFSFCGSFLFYYFIFVL